MIVRTAMALTLSALFALALAPALAAQSSGQNCGINGNCFTSYSEFQSWLPVVMIAVLVSVMAVSAYYMFGVVLSNTRIKSRALAELGQSVGTAIVIIGIIAVFSFVGTGIFAQVPAITPANLQKICSQLQNSQTTFLQPAFSKYNLLGDFSGPDQVPTPTKLVCNEVQNYAVSFPPSLTDSIDYGLFATYLIIANMTNQTLANYNAMYNFEGWMGFASKFTSVTQVCSLEVPGEASPLCGSVPPLLQTELKFEYQPLQGLEAFKSTITQPTEVQSALTFYMFFLQLVVSMLILYIWPWLLAAGIILRTSFFTRRAGGLLIAMVLAWLLIYPMLYAIEYNTFNNPNGGLQPIGGTDLPTLPLYTKNPSGTLGVYGAKEIGGYVPVSQDLQASSCPSSEYAYEEVCGYPQTTRIVTTRVGRASVTGPDCTSNPTTLCASSGFVPGASIPGSNCPAGAPYAYESTCGDPSSFAGVCSASNSPSCATYGTVTPEPININFFVFPSIADVLRFYSCMPSSLPGDEVAFAAYYLFPGYGAVTGILGGVSGLVTGVPYNPSDYAFNPLDPSFSCSPTQAINSALAIANVYGIVAVTAYLVPLLNLIVIISTVVGISGLLGGDTDIIGLSKLL